MCLNEDIGIIWIYFLYFLDSIYSFFFSYYFRFKNCYFKLRKKFEAIKPSKATNSETNTKKANLSVKRREKIRLPSYSGEGRTYHIREFLNHPSGIEAMLNKNALKSFQLLDANTYRSLPFLFGGSFILLVFKTMAYDFLFCI